MENIKNIKLVFIVLALLGCSTVEQTDTSLVQGREIYPDHDSFSYIGRFDKRESGEVVSSWSSSKISFDFDGSDADILLTVKEYSDIYFDVEIDGKHLSVLKVNREQDVYPLCRDLDPGRKRISIVRRNQFFAGAAVFKGLVIDSESNVYKTKLLKDRYIEFIGDSLSTGHGVEGKKDDSYQANTENASKSYAGVAAQELNSEYSIIAWSGKGLYRNHGTDKSTTMPELYSLINHGSDKLWNFKDIVPDLVVINLGANDFSLSPPDKDAFVSAYKDFIYYIHSKYEGVPVMCVVGHALSNNWPINKDTDTPYKTLAIVTDYMESLKNEFEQEGINIELIKVPSLNEHYQFGSQYHPGIKHNIDTGLFTAEKIKKYMNW